MSSRLIASVDDPRQLRQALGRFATGIAVMTTKTPEGKLEGVTANSFSSVSLDPPLVLWSLQKRASSLDSFRRSGHFVVNVLASEHHTHCLQFAIPAADKFAGIAYDSGIGGCPVLPNCLAHFECALHDIVDGGDHVILIGRVEHSSYRDGEPLIFSNGRFWVLAPHQAA